MVLRGCSWSLSTIGGHTLHSVCVAATSSVVVYDAGPVRQLHATLLHKDMGMQPGSFVNTFMLFWWSVGFQAVRRARSLRPRRLSTFLVWATTIQPLVKAP